MLASRRLEQEFQTTRDLLARHPRISLVSVEGRPPNKFTVEFRIRSLAPSLDGDSSEPIERFTHIAGFFLMPGYPRQPPRVKFVTPVFHPAISGDYTNLTDAWVPGWTLYDLILHVARALAYQEWDVQAPLNGEATNWARHNSHLFPFDGLDFASPALPTDMNEETELSLPTPPPHPVVASPPSAHRSPAPYLPPPPAIEILGPSPQRPAPAPVSSPEPKLDLTAPLIPEEATHLYQPPAPAAVLVNLKSGQTYRVTVDSAALGRSPQNEVVLDDPSVSRVHCRLERSADGFRIVDISSTNGTFVNEQKVSTSILRPGDKLRLGGVILRFEEGDSAATNS